MGQRGTLTKDHFGFTIPVDAPLYRPLPDSYKNVSMMIYDYETDPQAAVALLPSQLELPDGPAVCTLLFAEYPWSTLGPYNEVAQSITCTYKGKTFKYAARLHVTSDEAMAAGREMVGIPKKIGVIPFIRDQLYLSYLERPAGLRLCSGTLKAYQQIPGVIPLTLDFVSLRLIPNPENNATPSLAQLIQTQWLFDSGEMWVGQGSCQLTGASEIDPYHKLPILKMCDARLFMGTMRITAPGRILENL